VKGVGRATDEMIFGAVRTVMGKRGLRGTTLEAVAEVAGVSVVTLHRRFGDRLGLLRAFMDALPARRAGRDLMTADVHRVREVLTGFTRKALEEFQKSSEVTRAMLGDPAAAEELASKARDPARGVSAGVITYFTRCVEAGTLRGEPGALAAFFLSALFGYGLLIGTFQGGALATEASVALLVNGFLDSPRGAA
jgi:AcrR family transcriptional regulator